MKNTAERISNHNKQEALEGQRRLRRMLGAAGLTILTALGISHVAESNSGPESVEASAEYINSPDIKPESIINKDLEVGRKYEVANIVIDVDPKKVNIRKSPNVINPDNSGGDSNKYNISSKFTVANPVIVGSDINGTWAMASDRKGKNYFFTVTNGGLTAHGTDQEIDNLAKFMGPKLEIIATTKSGNVAEDRTGDKTLVATVVEIGNEKG
jgi:hypothetical protein